MENSSETATNTQSTTTKKGFDPLEAYANSVTKSGTDNRGKPYQVVTPKNLEPIRQRNEARRAEELKRARTVLVDFGGAYLPNDFKPADKPETIKTEGGETWHMLTRLAPSGELLEAAKNKTEVDNKDYGYRNIEGVEPFPWTDPKYAGHIIVIKDSGLDRSPEEFFRNNYVTYLIGEEGGEHGLPPLYRLDLDTYNPMHPANPDKVWEQDFSGLSKPGVKKEQIERIQNMMRPNLRVAGPVGNLEVEFHEIQVWSPKGNDVVAQKENKV